MLSGLLLIVILVPYSVILNSWGNGGYWLFGSIMFFLILPIIQFARNETMEWHGGGDFEVEKYKVFRKVILGFAVTGLLAWLWILYSIFTRAN